MDNNYTLGRGRVYVGRAGEEGERYVGNSPGFVYNPSVETVVTKRSRRGVVTPDRVHIVSSLDTIDLQLDDISTDNLAMFFRSNAEKGIVPYEETERELTIRRGQFFDLASGPVQEVVVRFDGEEIDFGSNFAIQPAIGLLQVKANPPGLFDGQVVKVSFRAGRIVREDFTPTAQARRGSLRYVEDNAKGSNRMFFWPDAAFIPAQAIDFKGDQWRTLEFQVTLTSMPRIVDTNLVDDYGWAAGALEDAVDFRVVTNATVTDDYGVVE